MPQEMHTYRCQTPVAGCTQFVVGDDYPILVEEPAPTIYQWPNGACAGTVFELNEPEDE